MGDDDGPSSSGRSRRQRPDKAGRLSALEALKQLKGSKNKYKVAELDNVYDEVDEKDYSKRVIDRQNDDWIVDDGGGGYVEDGREIFDDDLDDDSIQQAAKNKSLAGPRKRKKPEEGKAKGNIKAMFMNQASKKKAEEKFNDDDILGDIMSELNKDESTPKRKETQVRNKFAITPKAAPVKQNEPKSTSSVKDPLDDFDFDEPMFDFADKRKKIKTQSMFDVKKNGSKSEKSLNENQSTSQHIENDDTQSYETVDEVVETQNSTSQVIVEEDASQYEADLSTMNFDDMDMDIDVKDLPECTLKPLETQKCGSQYKETKEVEIEFGDQAWANDFEMQFTEADVATITNVELESIPLVTNEAGDKVFRFYWWDAFEDQWKQPGIVYLFGKVYNESSKDYVSCCLQIKNIPRRLHILPREFIEDSGKAEDEREETTMDDVYKEFNKWATKNRVTEFRSMKVTKKYAFDREDTPKECEYLEVRYPATYPPMDPNYTGPSIEHVFGTSLTAMELLLIERNIKGPCWLEVKNPLPAGNATSWCKLQVNCMKLENVSACKEELISKKLSIPPMVVVTLNVRMSLNAKHQQNEVVMIGILIQNKYHIDKAPPKPVFQQHYCLVTRPRDTTWPAHARDLLSKTKVIRCDTEFDLLEKFLDIIQNADPDLFVGYDCGFQFDVLMHRISNLKVKNWSRVGKLKRSILPVFKGKINTGQTFCGRPICDIQVSAKELNLKVRSYDLQSLCMAILKMKESECKEIKPADCPKFYSSGKEIENLVKITMNEAVHIMTLIFDLNVIPLAVQITCIAGNILSRTLSAGRAERNEYLLLHAFYKKGYITPDKRYAVKNKEGDGNTNSRRKKPAYAGGLVLDPKKGFYDTLILLMDFNSLYPSIIQEYNLCFTTVPGAAFAETTDLAVPEGDLEPGVVPTEIRKLVESRGAVKKLMKTPNLSAELKMQYNIRQLALKLTANSMYGCLGAAHCRFYAKGLAALVTAKGREILQKTKSLVEKLNYEVIYGDTDSIMINTNILDYDAAFTIAKKIKQEVNKLYKKIELDIDGVFRYLLLLQKKKYAAVLMSKSPSGQIELVMEHKGLDIVRRDWCQIACDTGKNILDQLLSDQTSESRREKIFEILQNVSKNIREGLAPLSSLVITKQLSKNPKDYPEKKLPHVAIALRLNAEGGRMWKAGDTVPYIICEDGTSRSATERAYHVDEFKKSDTLKIDINYYILSQVFPVVLRICDPIDGIDDVLLAEHLGMGDVYKSKRIIHESEDTQVPLQMNEDLYKYCIPLKFNCRKCLVEIELNEFLTNFPSGTMPSLAQCANPDCDMPPWKYVKMIQNKLQLALRGFIKQYYADWMECEDPICSNKTRHVPLNIRGTYPQCGVCNAAEMHRVYPETKLYNQISFFLHLVDLSKAPSNSLVGAAPGMISAYDVLKEFVENQLRRNAYSVVDLDRLFSFETTSQITETTVVEEADGSDYEVSDDELDDGPMPTEATTSE